MAADGDPTTTKELAAYRLNESGPPLVCAPAARAWMDATDERFAYRCLPMLIANQAGWFVLNECSFEATWNGARDPSGVEIQYFSDEGRGAVTSHFGEGIITWYIPYLFRTPSGYNLLVRGPSNWPKDGVQALEGLVESDWSYATFTMNWKLTRTDHAVRFDKGEPIYMLVPQPRGELEAFQPGLRDLGSDPTLSAGYRIWSESRSRFLGALKRQDAEASRQKWQKDYFQGRTPQGASTETHQTVLSLRPFPSPPLQPARIPETDPVRVGKRPRQQLDFRLERKFDTEVLLYHPAKTQALYLNATAALIWELCNGQRTDREIAELLRGAFPDAAETIDAEVASTLREFVEYEAVEFV